MVREEFAFRIVNLISMLSFGSQLNKIEFFGRLLSFFCVFVVSGLN